MGCALLGGRVCERGDIIRVHAVGVHQAEMPSKWCRFSVGCHQKHSSYGWSFRASFSPNPPNVFFFFFNLPRFPSQPPPQHTD